MRNYLNKVKRFGGNNIVFPFYVQQQKDYVLLSRFWYKIPEDVEDNNEIKLGYLKEGPKCIEYYSPSLSRNMIS